MVRKLKPGEGIERDKRSVMTERAVIGGDWAESERDVKGQGRGPASVNTWGASLMACWGSSRDQWPELCDVRMWSVATQWVAMWSLGRDRIIALGANVNSFIDNSFKSPWHVSKPDLWHVCFSTGSTWHKGMRALPEGVGVRVPCAVYFRGRECA